MRLENEELHYRAKFDVYPYATQNPAFEKLCQILWDWVRNKERRSRSDLFADQRGRVRLVPIHRADLVTFGRGDRI